MPVIADVDSDYDDIVSLAYLCQEHKRGSLRLAAVAVTNSGAGYPGKALRHVRCVLEACGLNDIPVADACHALHAQCLSSQADGQRGPYPLQHLLRVHRQHRVHAEDGPGVAGRGGPGLVRLDFRHFEEGEQGSDGAEGKRRLPDGL
ncbi:nucleoside hydrolase [Archangium violaceum]|nr:nucleoside hydrolase [Archangium violaceum]